MLPEGASPILKVDADEAREARAAQRVAPRRGGRIFGAVFAFAAIVGFGSLIAYYFVQNRDGHLDPASIPVVRADARPTKVRPENPGGLEVPFQNSEIYDNVGRQSAGGGAVRGTQGGERLLPGPEAPLPRPQPPPAPVPAIPAAPEIVVPSDAVVVTPPRVASIPPAGAPPAAAAAPPVTQPPQQSAAARPAPVPAPAAPAAAPPAASAAVGGSRIQLASVRDTAAAQREWARVSRQYADLLGHLTPQFIPADLGDRGVFVRVQAGPFASPEAAKATCDALRARGAGCNVVR